MRLSKNTILITGGSKGIGLALAKAFLKEDNHVIICGRNRANLERAKKELGVEAVVCDITNPKSLEALAKEAEARHVNILVNNAGILLPKGFREGSTSEDIRKELETNYIAPVHLIKLLLPHLEREDNSAIINVTSIAAFIPEEGMSTYCASKSALHSFTTSLRGLTSIKVFELIPPLVDTDMVRKTSGNKLTPEEVAQATLRGLRKDKKEIYIGRASRHAFLYRLFPKIVHKIVNKK